MKKLKQMLPSDFEFQDFSISIPIMIDKMNDIISAMNDLREHAISHEKVENPSQTITWPVMDGPNSAIRDSREDPFGMLNDPKREVIPELDLNECLHCGDSAMITQSAASATMEIGGIGYRYEIRCCECSMSTGWHITAEIAAKVWNRKKKELS